MNRALNHEEKAQLHKDLSTLIGLNPNPDLAHVVSIDAQDVAEKMLMEGADIPSKEGLDPMLVTLTLHTKKQALLNKLTTEQDETSMNMTIGKVMRILTDLGFEQVITFPVTLEQSIAGEGINQDQCLYIWANKDTGCVAAFESYAYTDHKTPDEQHMNAGRMHYCWRAYNWHTNSDLLGTGGIECAANPAWRLDRTGIPDDGYWKGYKDMRDPVRLLMRGLYERGEFLPSWPELEVPLGMFTTWWDYKTIITGQGMDSLRQSQQLGWERYQTCPDWFKAFTNCTQPRKI